MILILVRRGKGVRTLLLLLRDDGENSHIAPGSRAGQCLVPPTPYGRHSHGAGAGAGPGETYGLRSGRRGRVYYCYDWAGYAGAVTPHPGPCLAHARVAHSRENSVAPPWAFLFFFRLGTCRAWSLATRLGDAAWSAVSPSRRVSRSQPELDRLRSPRPAAVAFVFVFVFVLVLVLVAYTAIPPSRPMPTPTLTPAKA